MPTQTTNYNLLKPLVNDPTDEDLWGGELNDDLDDIDTLLRAGITVATQSSQTTGFTAAATISVKNLYPCDASGSAFNVTIPDAATSGNGATVFIKKTDASANAVTLLRSGSNTLDGDTSLSLLAESDCYGLVSDGVSAWSSICKPSTAIPDASTTVKGIVELATIAETLAGTDAVRALTAAGVSGSSSLSGNGYYQFPGGLTIQWGTFGTNGQGNTTTSVTFPLAFPTNCYGVVSIGRGPTAFVTTAEIISAISASGFTVYSGCTGSYWIAIGK